MSGTVDAPVTVCSMAMVNEEVGLRPWQSKAGLDLEDEKPAFALGFDLSEKPLPDIRLEPETTEPEQLGFTFSNELVEATAAGFALDEAGTVDESEDWAPGRNVGSFLRRGSVPLTAQGQVLVANVALASRRLSKDVTKRALAELPSLVDKKQEENTSSSISRTNLLASRLLRIPPGTVQHTVNRLRQCSWVPRNPVPAGRRASTGKKVALLES